VLFDVDGTLTRIGAGRAVVPGLRTFQPSRLRLPPPEKGLLGEVVQAPIASG